LAQKDQEYGSLTNKKAPLGGALEYQATVTWILQI